MTNIFQSPRLPLARISGICGILVPIVIFTGIGLAIVASPWFTWTHHALSDLGVDMSSAVFFNTALVVGGLLGLIFSIGLMRVLSNNIGAYFLAISSVALLGIGVFPETITALHFFTSATFFIVLAIALIIIGLTIRENRFERISGTLALVFGVIAISSTVFLLPLEGVAIPEALSCFPAFIWCLIIGLKMTFVPG